MRGIDLLKYYFTSEVIGRFIINTTNDHGVLPISPECNRYFHQEINGIDEICSFLEGSFYWGETPEGNSYWFNILHPITIEIIRNGLPNELVYKMEPRFNIKPLKFI